VEERAHNAFVKPKRDIERYVKKYFSGVVDEAAAIAFRDCGETFTETFCVGELQRDC
jgi:hypothetical protein